jgi:hypothetical protein
VRREQRQGGPRATGDQHLIRPRGQALAGQAGGDPFAEFGQAWPGFALAEQQPRGTGQRAPSRGGVGIHGCGRHGAPQIQQVFGAVNRQRRIPQAQRGRDPHRAATAVPGGEPALAPQPGKRGRHGAAADAKLTGQAPFRGQSVGHRHRAVENRVAHGRGQRLAR